MQPRLRRRLPPPQQNVYVEFEPSAEWVQEPSNHILRLQVPGFKMEEVRITPEKSGKITVWGRRQAGAFRITGFEHSYDVPKNSNLEKMAWKINDGVLELTIPKTEVAVEPRKEDMPFEEKKKEPMLIVEGPLAAVEGRKEEVVQPNEINVAQEAAGLSEMNRELTMKEPKVAVEEKKEAAEVINELKEIVEEFNPEKKADIAAEVRKEEVAAKDKQKMLEDKEEANQNEVAGRIDEKMIEKEEPHRMIGETMSESFAENDKSEKNEDPNKPKHCHEGLQESQKEKKCRGKRRRSLNEDDKSWLGWLDCELIDGVFKKVKRNGKLITIALMVISTGLYITKKLRKKG